MAFTRKEDWLFIVDLFCVLLDVSDTFHETYVVKQYFIIPVVNTVNHFQPQQLVPRVDDSKVGISVEQGPAALVMFAHACHQICGMTSLCEPASHLDEHKLPNGQCCRRRSSG